MKINYLYNHKKTMKMKSELTNAICVSGDHIQINKKCLSFPFDIFDVF